MIKSKLYRPDVDSITLQWMNEFQQKYGLSDYELSLQLGQERNYIYHIKVGKMKMNKAAKAALWHFEKRLKVCENKS